MATKKKTWREKLADSKDLPKVVKIAPPHRKRWGGATLAIPAPRDVDALMRQVPAGKVTTIQELRGAIAKRHRAAAETRLAAEGHVIIRKGTRSFVGNLAGALYQPRAK